MNDEIRPYDIVEMIVDDPVLGLRKGDTGTVVDSYMAGLALEVEFERLATTLVTVPVPRCYIRIVRTSGKEDPS